MGKIIRGVFDKHIKNSFKTTAIIAAGGTGSRMGLNFNKLFLMIDEKPVLAHTLDVFEKCQKIDEIVIVANESDIKTVKEVVEDFGYSKVETIATGGKTRQESVYKGLLCVSEDTQVVAIHDAARPLINPNVIIQCIDAAYELGASAAGISAKDTLKRVNEKNIITETVDRENVVQIQTPQCFRKDIIIEAHEKAISDGFSTTDDCAVVEKYGTKVKVIPGNSLNIKLTTPDDYYALSAFITYRGEFE